MNYQKKVKAVSTKELTKDLTKKYLMFFIEQKKILQEYFKII